MKLAGVSLMQKEKGKKWKNQRNLSTTGKEHDYALEVKILLARKNDQYIICFAC